MTQQERHERFTRKHYRSFKGYDPGSVRSGHSDAAHMYDAIAADILVEHTVRGKVTKRGQELAAAVKRAGDAVWAMRKLLPEREL